MDGRVFAILGCLIIAFYAGVFGFTCYIVIKILQHFGIL